MKEFKQEVQLSIRGLKKSYGDAETSKGVNLDARRGEAVVIPGPSDSGKPTFLRCINGLEEIQDGGVKLDGTTINGPKNGTLPAVRQKPGMVLQSYDLLPRMNTLGNIMLAFTKMQKRSRKEAEAGARELPSRVNLVDREKAYSRMLSGGQEQRVAIVRVPTVHPELVLFDEVTAALDPEMVHEVLGVIIEFSEQGLTMLAATHETSFARVMADHIAFVDGGHIVETGMSEEFFTAPKTEHACTSLGNSQFTAKSRKEEKSA